MPLVRNYPISDDDKKAVLLATKTRKDQVDPSANVLSPTNSDALDEHQPLFITKLSTLNTAEEGFKAANNPYLVLIEKLRSNSSHALQLVNHKIIDQFTGFLPEHRKFYNLDDKGHIPSSSTDEDIINMGLDVITGETKRIAAGGPALVDYKKADIQTMLDNVYTKKSLKVAAKDTFVAALAAANAERDFVDELIKSMWGDIEHAAQSLPEASRHGFCETWAMRFMHATGYGYANIRTEDFDTHAALPAVALRLGKPTGTGGPKTTSNVRGEAFLKSKNFKPTAIIAEHILYETKVVEVTLLEDQTIDVIIRMKKKPIQEQS